jgi:hypothetical protein
MAMRVSITWPNLSWSLSHLVFLGIAGETDAGEGGEADEDVAGGVLKAGGANSLRRIVLALDEHDGLASAGWVGGRAAAEGTAGDVRVVRHGG